MSGNRFAVAVVFLLIASAGFAQSNDVAVSFGGTFSPGVKGQAVCEALPTCPTGIVDRSLIRAFPLKARMLIGWQTLEWLRSILNCRLCLLLRDQPAR
jgi:hypothetical protein